MKGAFHSGGRLDFGCGLLGFSLFAKAREDGGVGLYGVRGGRRAFTLVELILVVLIIAMTSAIAMPSFVQSIKGARLRTSARKVVSTCKYARSMAVLQQRRVLLRYDFVRRRMEVAFLPEGGRGRAGVDRLLESGELFGGVSAVASSEEASGAHVDIVRTLEGGVYFEDFRGVDGRGDLEEDWVAFYPNGMCDAHSFRLLDGRGKEVLVEVEAFTGDIRVEFVR